MQGFLPVVERGGNMSNFFVEDLERFVSTEGLNRKCRHL